MGSSVPVLLVVIFSTLSFSFSYCYAATDTISVNKPMRDGEKIVSASGSYELGFFSPLANSTSQKRYLGIWCKFSNSTVVWVANREAPLNDASGVLQVTSQGILAIRSSSNVTIWLSGSTNASKQVQNPIAQILDTGNFVVREADDTNEDNYLWQSFESPGDTLLPGTRFGKNLVTGVDWKMVSWKSTSDPSFGDSTEGIDVRGYPQLYNKIGETTVFRSGPWNGLNFGGVHGLKPNPIYSYQLVYTKKEIYLNYEVIDKSTFFRMILRNGGLLQKFIWNNNTREWDLEFTSWRDQCDNYALCGAFGSCNISSSPMCNCLEGFTPRFPQDWKSGNWSGGCTRKNDLVCGTGERFQKIDGVKLPDSSKSWFNRTMTLTECERECRRNCSCTAYSTLDISTGFGCLLWFGELLDTRLYDGNGQSFYLKLGTSEPGQIDTSKSFGKKKLLVGIITSSVALIGLLIVGLILYICNKKRRKQGMAKRKFQMFFDHKEGKGDVGFPLFDLATVVKATENFQEDNKLGEGGFGPVFKGTLVDGQEIAVKRLSKNSGQGLEEFKNEVILIAKLQHRNLVRLLGCCVEGDEKMLIYEFMPNKSLDYLIFDQTRTMLDWGKRGHIINGIARGLLYLHQDSRLRVIHRDLKASNILLDANMNPKISDFGLARMFGGDQTEAKTKKVFGTYGYMPPEYAVNGRFSMKSDVFSFGVLVLEIVSGKQNRGFSSPDHSQNLLGHAWELWTQERPLELLYGNLDDVCAEPEVKRCIQVGLLCVQQRPEDRPNMSSVVLMLGSESPLPQPKQPAFFTQMNIPDSKTWSANGMSITLPDPR